MLPVPAALSELGTWVGPHACGTNADIHVTEPAAGCELDGEELSRKQMTPSALSGVDLIASTGIYCSRFTTVVKRTVTIPGTEAPTGRTPVCGVAEQNRSRFRLVTSVLAAHRALRPHLPH